MRIYTTHLIYNLDLNKYWKSGEGWIDSPEKASRYSKNDAEFIKTLMKEPHAGDPEPYELEVHPYRVLKEVIFEKLARVE